MDLAKIRQKARQELETQIQEESVVPCSPEASSSPVIDAVPVPPEAQEDDFFSGIVPAPPVASYYEDRLPDATLHRRTPKDPLKAILAGREAAGCYEAEPEAAQEHSDTETDDYREYLCFRVSNEVYGIDIMEIKELIRPREATEVPRAPSFVSGVISLRGIIIPIIDMMDRLGLPRETVTGRERVIVVRQGDSFSGLLVDEIIQVLRIETSCIEAPPTVLEGIDRDFVSGIGRADGRMVIILNLVNITDIHLY